MNSTTFNNSAMLAGRLLVAQGPGQCAIKPRQAPMRVQS
jgi:hypothetical protein